MEIVGFVDEERLNGMFLSFPRNVGCLLFLHCRQQPS